MKVFDFFPADHDCADKAIQKCKDFAEIIIKKKDVLLSILTRIESYSYANDEIERSVQTLLNIHLEKDFLSVKARLICSFLPINQPLYGLILFGLIPSLVAENIYIRPSIDTLDVVLEVSALLNIPDIWSNVELLEITRTRFLSDYVSRANVNIFVGKYQNAKVAQSYANPSSLFLFSGSGINPFVVAYTHDLDVVVDKAIKARLYNSGQDCAAPNVFIVNEAQKDAFIDLLIRRLKSIKVGEYSDKEVAVGPLIREASFKDSVLSIAHNRQKILFNGHVDIKNKIIFPTVLVANIWDRITFQEQYAPIFTFSTYYDEIELKQYFYDIRYIKNAMYVSVFGDLKQPKYLNNSIILHSKSVLDEEQGNLCFGGYGSEANYVWDGEAEHSRPILITKEIYQYVTRWKS